MREIFAKSRRQRVRRMVRLLAGMLATLLVLWGGGLVWFARQLPREVADGDRITDAIVVLTGGSGRVETGLKLLARERAKKLFISGVYRGVEVNEILRFASEAPEDLACCIALGYVADNTAGNALETAEWMRGEGYHSLRLVTAAYHMPRSLVEFRRAMPDVEIVPHPIFPDHVKQSDWWRWPGTALLFASEYNKYLASWLRAAFMPTVQPS